MNGEGLERKLKLERVAVCLNCRWFVECCNVGEFEECADFVEVDVEEQVVIVSLSEYAKLRDGEPQPT